MQCCELMNVLVQEAEANQALSTDVGTEYNTSAIGCCLPVWHGTTVKVGRIVPCVRPCHPLPLAISLLLDVFNSYPALHTTCQGLWRCHGKGHEDSHSHVTG